MGTVVAASTPAGTSRKPVAFWPGATEAVPTVKRDWAFVKRGVKKRAARTKKRKRIGYLREGMELNARTAMGQGGEWGFQYRGHREQGREGGRGEEMGTAVLRLYR